MHALVVWKQITDSGHYVPDSVEHYALPTILDMKQFDSMESKAGLLEAVLETQGQTWIGKLVRVHKDLIQIVLDIQPQDVSRWALMDPKSYEWQNRPDPRNG